MVRRTFRLAAAILGGMCLIYVGFAIFAARVALFPWWYKTATLGRELPECTSYQLKVYAHCHDPLKSLGLDFAPFEREKTVREKTVRTSGWWVWPKRLEDEKGIVVLVHGGGADRRAMLKHVSYLTANGYHAVLIDCHNHGLNTSDGRGISFGLWESESVISAVEWATTNIRRQTEPKNAALPVYVFGTSQGAFAALRAAAQSELILGVIAENPYVSVRRVLVEFPAMDWLPRAVKESSLFLIGLWLDHPVSGLDVTQFADSIGQRPVLLIHGEKDIVTPIDHSKAILASLSGPKDLWVVPRGDHEYIWNVTREEYERRVLGFLNSNNKR